MARARSAPLARENKTTILSRGKFGRANWLGAVGKAARFLAVSCRRTLLQERGGRGDPFRAAETGGEGLLQAGQREVGAGLAISAGAFVHRVQLEEAQQGLHLAHDFPAGSVALKDLPEPAPESGRQIKHALPGVRAVRRFLEDPRVQGGGGGLFDLGQRGLPEGVAGGGAAGAHGGQHGPQRREERGWIHVQYYYWTRLTGKLKPLK